MTTIDVKNLGPIERANIVLRDVTVLVGPQATGKSILLQLLKLLTDTGPIRRELKRFNIDWNAKLDNFLDLS